MDGVLVQNAIVGQICTRSQFCVCVCLCLCQALGVFGLCQIHAFVDYVHSRLTREQFHILFRGLVLFAAVAGLSSFGIATFFGSILRYFVLSVVHWF